MIRKYFKGKSQDCEYQGFLLVFVYICLFSVNTCRLSVKTKSLKCVGFFFIFLIFFAYDGEHHGDGTLNLCFCCPYQGQKTPDA